MFKSIKPKDRAALLGYCSLLAAVALPVALLTVRAWVSEGVVPATIRQLSAPIGEIEFVAAGAFGLYLGLLALLGIDTMIRVTALIMTVVTGAALGLFATLGVFFRYLTVVNLGVRTTASTKIVDFAHNKAQNKAEQYADICQPENTEHQQFLIPIVGENAQ